MQGGVNYNGSTLLSGGINVNVGGNIEPLTLTYNENGNYVVNAPEGVDGYDPLTINVNVQQLEPVLDTLIVSQNGQYRPPSGVVGYNLVDVNVITPPPVLDTLNVSQNGQYTPPEGVVGYNQVNVNVPGPVLNTLNVSSNGTYTPASGVDGYDEINVNVPVNKNYLSRIGLFQLNNEANYNNALVQTSLDGFNTTWKGGPNIGFCALGTISLSGFSRFNFSVGKVGRNYQYANNNNNRNFNLAFVVTDIQLSNFPQIIQLDANNNILAIKEYSGITYYDQSIEDFIDLSNISGNYYINLFMQGYNLTNVKFDIV